MGLGMKYFKFFLVRLVLIIISALITSLLIFIILESFPSIIRYTKLYRINYFDIKYNIIPHHRLAFVIRPNTEWIGGFVGDRYSPDYGIEPQRIKYIAHYNELGFRVNSSRPPYKIIVIGDSYAEIGENDKDTLSEYLNKITGLSSYNLGLAWYGPFQYIEVLKLYGLKLHPKYAILCFFAGNDIKDIREYLKWLNGGSYYGLNQSKTFFERYKIAVIDSISYVYHLTHDYFVLKKFKNKREYMHPNLGLIKLKNIYAKMVFDYWNVPESSEQLVSSKEWQILGSLLKEFKNLCHKNGIIPIIVYIPTQIEVYGEYYSTKSGSHFLERIKEQLVFQNNSSDAMEKLTKDINIKLINLLPHFRKLAGEGELLYYPFDTHWNPGGKKAAAEFIATSLGLNPNSTKK